MFSSKPIYWELQILDCFVNCVCMKKEKNKLVSAHIWEHSTGQSGFSSLKEVIITPDMKFGTVLIIIFVGVSNKPMCAGEKND